MREKWKKQQKKRATREIWAEHTGGLEAWRRGTLLGRGVPPSTEQKAGQVEEGHGKGTRSKTEPDLGWMHYLLHSGYFA